MTKRTPLIYRCAKCHKLVSNDGVRMCRKCYVQSRKGISWAKWRELYSNTPRADERDGNKYKRRNRNYGIPVTSKRQREVLQQIEEV
jgi:hypothetical protein